MFVKLSPTKVSTWQACPRRYYLSYVARRRSTRAWAHLSYGNAVHSALRGWFDLPAEQRSMTIVPELVERAWSDAGFRDAEQRDACKKQATDIVRSYLQGLDPDFEPLSVERTLAFKENTFVMEGRIDRLDESSTAVAVVDYKTGKLPPSTDDVRSSSALAMYALMVQRTLNRPCFDVALHHVPSGTEVGWTHSPESLERQLSRMSEIAADIARAQDTWDATGVDSETADEVLDVVFPAHPSPLCGFCDFWDECAPGQAQARRRDSWDGLALDENEDTH